MKVRERIKELFKKNLLKDIFCFVFWMIIILAGIIILLFAECLMVVVVFPSLLLTVFMKLEIFHAMFTSGIVSICLIVMYWEIFNAELRLKHSSYSKNFRIKRGVVSSIFVTGFFLIFNLGLEYILTRYCQKISTAELIIGMSNVVLFLLFMFHYPFNFKKRSISYCC